MKFAEFDPIKAVWDYTLRGDGWSPGGRAISLQLDFAGSNGVCGFAINHPRMGHEFTNAGLFIREFVDGLDTQLLNHKIQLNQEFSFFVQDDLAPQRAQRAQSAQRETSVRSVFSVVGC